MLPKLCHARVRLACRCRDGGPALERALASAAGRQRGVARLPPNLWVSGLRLVSYR